LNSRELEVIRGSSHSRELMNSLAQAITEAGIQGSLYIGYPVLASADSNLTVDALLISRSHGVVAFHFFRAGEDYKDTQDRLHYVLEANLGRHETLRKGRDLVVKVNVISIFPEGATPAEASPEYPATCLSRVGMEITGLPAIADERVFRLVNAAIQRVTSIKPHKRRANVTGRDTKGAIVKLIEKEIANLDQWQKGAAIETPDAPQRIRGLAGSGKTIVLALKAAYLHTQHPDWKIAVTFHTRSLYQQFRDLIERFTLEHMGDMPDWQQLHLVHSWGSSSERGIYSMVCDEIGMSPTNYLTAKARFGVSRSFTGVCDELASALRGRALDLYDAVLIDEAQDLPRSFFQIVNAIAKEPKRIVFAYDELQNLSESAMATPTELFGREISLLNPPGGPRQDIMLPVCYRNTPWALTLAHALGFGLFREKGIIQHFDDPLTWAEIGYVARSGSIKSGKKVSLKRDPSATPEYFESYLKSDDAVAANRFANKNDQYAWIAESVRHNLEVDELDPDDILIILCNPLSQREEYYELRRYLQSYSITTCLAGVTNDRDAFTLAGAVTVSGVYRAKGNEAPMVYIANADYCTSGHEMIRLRNMLFTAITRSRAWVRLCGVADRMDELLMEIAQVIQGDYSLVFKVPTADQLEQMRRLNRDRTESERERIRKAESDLQDLLDLLRSGVISADAMPRLDELVREIERRKSEL